MRMERKRILALDVGDVRIGIAVSDPLFITAQGVETYTRIGYGPDTRHICELARKYETDQILCGLPKNMDGSEGFQAEKVRAFMEKLQEAGEEESYLNVADIRGKIQAIKAKIEAAGQDLGTWISEEREALQRRIAKLKGEDYDKTKAEKQTSVENKDKEISSRADAIYKRKSKK